MRDHHHEEHEHPEIDRARFDAELDAALAAAFDNPVRIHRAGGCRECGGALHDGMDSGTCTACANAMPRDPTVITKSNLAVLQELHALDLALRARHRTTETVARAHLRRPAPGVRRGPSRARRARPACRTTRVSARSGDSGSGSDGPGDAGHHLTLATTRAIYTYAVITPNQGGWA